METFVMPKMLLPYGELRNSDIVAKNGAHSAEKKLRSREIDGKTVVRVERLSA